MNSSPISERKTMGAEPLGDALTVDGRVVRTKSSNTTRASTQINRTNVKKISRDGDPFHVLIPSMELVRFYFGVSNELLTASLSGLVGGPQRLYLPEASGCDANGNCVLATP